MFMKIQNYLSILIRKNGLFVALIVLMLITGLLNPRFSTMSNFINILRQSSINVLLAVGSVFVISHGEIDLSIGSIVALTGTIAAGFAVQYSTLVGIVLSITLGIILGFLNGFIVNYLILPSFIVTLATMTIARGFGYVYTQGVAITGLPQSFTYLGNGRIGSIPLIIIIASIIVIFLDILFRRTKFGRYTRAVGDNREAARLSGIQVKKHSIIVFILNGLLASIAGILLTSRIISGHPGVGSGYELNAIAAVVIGGGSLKGGTGSVPGTVLGAFFMTTLSNALNLLSVSSFWQMIIVGIVIILAISTERFRK